MSEAPMVIAADAVSVDYDGERRLHDVSLRVPAGRMLAITGSAGAGKTTLLWALAGLVSPAAGAVTAGGQRRRRHANGARIVLMPQGDGLAGVLSATENVVVPLLASGVPPREAQSRAATALEAVGLGEAGSQLVEELSGGQQQRVCVARGLARRGDVVLADEPTSAVDAANRGLVMELLRAEAGRGAAVVVATHDPEAAAACDGELHLDDGRASWVRPLG
ncbi:MAG: ABC transporter ATP-binding protein [Actinomycetales bacterium]